MKFDLMRFWELESIPNVAPESLRDDMIVKTVTGIETGRYVVTLPCESPPELGNKETRALKCFYHFEVEIELVRQKKPLFRGHRLLSLNIFLDPHRIIREYVASQFIRWHFIPPYFPHFWGILEAAVKQTKNYLLQACSASVLNFEELSTLLFQVEECLSSKPLVPLSSDPRDVRVLTPGLFLIGSPLLEIPD
ncbi:hypothetical protein AVEN_174817-1 [Araneus ventricosus]|uniref:Uncharacterized protein n=1 Tax=Araneus ventricosus TaxID=182803 RepID=A0A4Y2NZ68_ARAVE|nr:hypothetical protein AVEN_174817-1 [Araneus ventricosus]